MTSPILETPLPAPEISGLDGHGKFIKWEHIKHFWKILYFYPRDSTPGCTTEAVDFQRLSEEFEEKNAIILGA